MGENRHCSTEAFILKPRWPAAPREAVPKGREGSFLHSGRHGAGTCRFLGLCPSPAS